MAGAQGRLPNVQYLPKGAVGTSSGSYLNFSDRCDELNNVALDLQTMRSALYARACVTGNGKGTVGHFRYVTCLPRFVLIRGEV